MNKKQSKSRTGAQNDAIGLGLLFGVVVGIVLGPMIFDDPSVGIGVGISFGLVFGVPSVKARKGNRSRKLRATTAPIEPHRRKP